MISKAIIDAIIKQAKPADKDNMLSIFITNLGEGCSYNDDKVTHCLEILLGETKPIHFDNIDIDYIKKNLNQFIYKSETYIIKDIEVKRIDDTKGLIYVDYKYKGKTYENRDDIDFVLGSVEISFIDFPKVLK